MKKEYEFYKNSSLTKIAKHLYKNYILTLPSEYLSNINIKDSIQNECIAMAQEAKLQALDWGFTSKDISQKTYIYHGINDEEVDFQAAKKSSSLLSSCKFEKLENQSHCDPKSFYKFLEKLVDAVD